MSKHGGIGDKHCFSPPAQKDKVRRMSEAAHCRASEFAALFNISERMAHRV